MDDYHKQILKNWRIASRLADYIQIRPEWNWPEEDFRQVSRILDISLQDAFQDGILPQIRESVRKLLEWGQKAEQMLREQVREYIFGPREPDPRKLFKWVMILDNQGKVKWDKDGSCRLYLQGAMVWLMLGSSMRPTLMRAFQHRIEERSLDKPELHSVLLWYNAPVENSADHKRTFTKIWQDSSWRQIPSKEESK